MNSFKPIGTTIEESVIPSRLSLILSSRMKRMFDGREYMVLASLNLVNEEPIYTDGEATITWFEKSICLFLLLSKPS